MVTTLTTFLAIPLGFLSLYLAQKSYLAIINLHSNQDRAEKAARYSDKAARELWRTRLTQASGAAAVLFSLLSSLALIFFNPSLVLLGLANVAVEVAAYMHISGFWEAKAQVPFMTQYNEGIRKSNDLRRLLVLLGVAWACTGAMGYLTT